MKHYSLTTAWHLAAPIEMVWEAIVAAKEWPRWWRYVKEVCELEPGNVHGIGALRRFVWSSRLPYRLAFDMRTTKLEQPTLLEAMAAGDLNGMGRWRLHPVGATTIVEYVWTVNTGKAWMNCLAPFLAPIFAWNHDEVMVEGGRGLARHLGGQADIVVTIRGNGASSAIRPARRLTRMNGSDRIDAESVFDAHRSHFGHPRTASSRSGQRASWQ